MEIEGYKEFLEQSSSLKPRDFIIDDLKWKYLLWAIIKKKNIVFVGHTRCGKTRAIKAAAEALHVPLFVFNMGSTQDARATLIGNTMFEKSTGTVFYPSEFVKAIQTKNSIILLDELTRADHSAWNILMPVLDPTLRFLRLDEKEDSATIKVENVCFAATANIGSEYTATKILDRAISARFPIKIEMSPLMMDDLLKLISILHPKLDIKKKSEAWNIADFCVSTVKDVRAEDAKISTIIPTGTVLEMIEMLVDGFSIEEIMQVVVYPEYPDDGGIDSERTYIKQKVDKYIVKKGVKNPVTDPLKHSNG